MNKYLNKLLFLVTLVFVSNGTQAARVDSMSLEVFKGNVKPSYWEVSVNCEGQSEAKLMRRLTDAKQWCLSNQANTCDVDKFALSQRLCGDNKQQDTGENAIANPAPSRADLLKEQMWVEEQRLLIQQKRLELQRQELELRKRQIDA